jgi:hypothetical protein
MKSTPRTKILTSYQARSINVRSCRPIHHVAGQCCRRSSCRRRKPGSLRTGCSGLLLGDRQRRRDRRIGFRLGYRGVRGHLAGDVLGSLRSLLVGIEEEGARTLEPCLLRIRVGWLGKAMGLVRWLSWSHRRASSHHHLAGCFGWRCSVAGFDLGKRILDQMHHVHRKHHFLPSFEVFGQIVLIQHDRTRPDLRPEHCHDHATMMLHQIHLRQAKTHADHKERQGSFHSLGMVGEDLPSHHRVLLGNFQHHIVGIGSYTQRSMGWRSKGAHMGNCRVVVDRAGVEHHLG